jgi:hypothetical protein
VPSADRSAAILGADRRRRLAWLCAPLLGLGLLLAACDTTTPPEAATPEPATPASVVLATAVPSLPPSATQPSATPTTESPGPDESPTTESGEAAAVEPLYVANTGGLGLTLRKEPGGERIDVLPDGTELTPTGDEQEADGRLWRQVTDPQERAGWVAAEFLTAEKPPPAPTEPVRADVPPAAEPAAPPVAPAAVAPSPRPTARAVAASRSAVSTPTGVRSCSDFASQSAAQAALRANPSDPWGLDRDKNGIACESNRPPKNLTPVPRR